MVESGDSLLWLTTSPSIYHRQNCHGFAVRPPFQKFSSVKPKKGIESFCWGLEAKFTQTTEPLRVLPAEVREDASDWVTRPLSVWWPERVSNPFELSPRPMPIYVQDSRASPVWRDTHIDNSGTGVGIRPFRPFQRFQDQGFTCSVRALILTAANRIPFGV